MYTYTYTYTYIYMRIHIRIHMCICICICLVYIYTNMYVHMYIYICILYSTLCLPNYLSISPSIYLSVCMYTYIAKHLSIYTHTHTHTHIMCIYICYPTPQNAKTHSFRRWASCSLASSCKSALRLFRHHAESCAESGASPDSYGYT